MGIIRRNAMDKKFTKIESTYWKIAKIIGVIFTLINYQIWVSAGNIATAIKGLLLIIGVAVAVFVAINLLDLVIGLIKGIFKHIHKSIKDRRVLKSFYSTESGEEIDYNATE